MFFDDLGPLKKRALLRVPPRAPDTGWRPPTSFPNLSDAAIIGFDVERREDDWSNGPGWKRGKAITVGFSISARDHRGNRGSWYFPTRHAVESEYNLDPIKSMDYLRSVLCTSIPKVGANLLYDVGSLTDDNIQVNGELHDVQFAEALLQSDGEVNLDYLAFKYLKEHKTSNELYQWCADAYGGKPNGSQRDNIWRAPPTLAGPYGEADASLPIDILEKQWPLLIRENQLDLYRMECDLIPLLVKMRLAGMSVDVAAAEQLYHELATDIKEQYHKIALGYTQIESVNSNDDIAKLFDYAELKYPVTEHGNPSFRKDWLKNLDHPLADLINETREMEKIHGTFIRNYILNKNVNGKLYCQFHPLRGDDGGTITGRFSSSDPNLQNIPVRTNLGKAIRRIFIYDRGHKCIEKNDMSQQEYRDLAHYAVGPGSDELRAEYNQNPNTDYHERTQRMTKELAGVEIERRPIKNMNFGLVYGMQEKKLIRQNGFTPDAGKRIFKAYHLANPYVRPTMDAAAAEMQQLGYITTILGRRIRFNTWEPIFRDYGKPRPPALPFEMAINQYGSAIKRAGDHKAINYRLQGSNADQIKKGMRDCHKAGIYDYCGVPRLQVHDELVHSVPDESPAVTEALKEMRHVLETCIPQMSVPVRVDFKRGPNWGACE